MYGGIINEFLSHAIEYQHKQELNIYFLKLRITLCFYHVNQELRFTMFLLKSVAVMAV